jgi:hypothetical protein
MYIHMYVNVFYTRIHINLSICISIRNMILPIDDDDDVYLIAKLKHVGNKIYLLTDQPRQDLYKMNSNQQINK